MVANREKHHETWRDFYYTSRAALLELMFAAKIWCFIVPFLQKVFDRSYPFISKIQLTTRCYEIYLLFSPLPRVRVILLIFERACNSWLSNFQCSIASDVISVISVQEIKKGIGNTKTKCEVSLHLKIYRSIYYISELDFYQQDVTLNTLDTLRDNNIHYSQKHPLAVFYKKAVLKNFAISTGKHLYWSSLLIKLQTSRSATSLKRDSNAGVFPWISLIF